MIVNKSLLGSSKSNNTASVATFNVKSQDSFSLSENTKSSQRDTSEAYKSFYMAKLAFCRNSEKILVVGPPSRNNLVEKRLYAYPESFSCELRIPTEADIANRNLSFCDLTGLTRDQISKIDFKKTNLMGAKLTGLNLAGKDFSNACLVFADLSNTNLTDATLSRCDLSNSLLMNANLTRTKFNGADLKMSSLSKVYTEDLNKPTVFDHAHLDFAYIASSTLPGASFNHALMYNTFIHNTKLQAASFIDTDMTGAKLTRTNLTNAKFLDNTILNKSFFHAANLTSTDFVKTKLQEATIYASNITAGTFKDNDMTRTKLENTFINKSKFIGNHFTSGSVKSSIFLDTTFRDNKITDTPMEEGKFLKLEELDKKASKTTSGEEKDYDIDYKIFNPTQSTSENPTGFDKVAGMQEIKELFQDKIINVLKYPDIAKNHNAKIPNGALLYGEGGCGKTFIVESLVEEISKTIDKDIPYLKLEDTESKYQHGTSELIGEHIKKAKELAKKYGLCVVLLDEAEKLIASRDRDGNHQHNIEETAKMLNQLNELSKEGVLVIAATNHLNMLDKQAIRAGRFDYKVKVNLPSVQALKEAVIINLKSDPSASILVKELSEGKHDQLMNSLEGFTFADAAAICKHAGSLSFNEAIQAKSRDPNATDIKTTINHLTTSVEYAMKNKVAPPKNTDYQKGKIGFLADI